MTASRCSAGPLEGAWDVCEVAGVLGAKVPVVIGEKAMPMLLSTATEPVKEPAWWVCSWALGAGLEML